MLSALHQQLKDKNQRLLLRLSGNREWAHNWLENNLTSLPELQCLWFGVAPVNESQNLQQHLHAKLKQYKKYLGQETDVLIFDCYDGFNPDAFGALVGTVKLGGLCILVTPEDESWLNYADPELARFCTEPYRVEQLTSFYIQRLIALLNHNDDVLTISQTKPLNLNVNDICLSQGTIEASLATNGITAEQQQVISQCLALTNQHDKNAILLQADRGRGKSASLGMAAAQIVALMLSNKLNTHAPYKIVVTAPINESIQVLLLHCQLTLQQLGLEYSSSATAISLSGAEVVFFAPDHLMLHRPDADLVVIDEAAAIPIQMLKPVISHYNKLVLSTTVHGYEGTGRGFEYKLKPLLQKTFPKLTNLTLSAPIRWCKEDLLERISNELLAMALSLPKLPDYQIGLLSNISFSQYHAQQLIKSEQNLQAIFSLLVNAHYRTSPNDLRQMLDSPNMTVLCMDYDGVTVAAALVAKEGQLSPSLIESIWQGRRRPKGHLFPQSMIAHAGLKGFGEMFCHRVVRIAVHPKWQQHGLGSLFLDKIEQWSLACGGDYLCTSFGFEPALYQFWLNNHFAPVRLGLKADASTGEHSVLMLKNINSNNLNPNYAARITLAIDRFAQTHYVEHKLGMRTQCLVPIGATNIDEMHPEDWQDLHAFAFHFRGLNTVLLAMYKYVYTSSDATTLPSIVLDKLTPGISDKSLIKKHNLPGDKALVQQLRLQWQAILSQHSAIEMGSKAGGK